MNEDTRQKAIAIAVLVGPILLVLVFILDAISQIVAAHGFVYTPHDWLLNLISGLTAVTVSQYFQADYRRKKEAAKIADEIE